MNVIAFIWPDIPWKISIIIYMAISCRLMYHTRYTCTLVKNLPTLNPQSVSNTKNVLLAKELDEDYIVKIYIPFLTIDTAVSKLT